MLYYNDRNGDTDVSFLKGNPMLTSKQIRSIADDEAKAKYFALGGSITFCKASKKQIKTFGSKGARFQRGAKANTLRSAGYAKASG